jgi:uncharacterized protein YggE
LSGTLCAAERHDVDNDRRIVTVQGEGKVQAVPDIATLSVEVSQEGEDLDPVTAEVRRQMARVLESVRTQAIEEKDIQTQVYNVRPKWEYDKSSNPHRAGYTVTNRITIKVRDLKKVGKVLAAVIQNGATAVNGPDFEVDNRQAFERKALAAAYDDAHGKAAALADAAGVKLGDILAMNPGQIGWPNPRRPRSRSPPASRP